MEHVKNLLHTLIVIMLITSCNYFPRYDTYTESQFFFTNTYQHDSLFSHFPDEECETRISFYSSPPAINDRYQVLRGVIYLVCKIHNQPELREEFRYVQSCHYNPANCFTIEELFADDPVGRYPYANRYVPGQLPVPRMESLDFGLGYREHEDPNYPELPVRTYNLPEDLEVHVIEADSGYFWKEKVEVFRPQELGPWKHGYSRGVALSEKEQMVGYWVMVW